MLFSLAPVGKFRCTIDYVVYWRCFNYIGYIESNETQRWLQITRFGKMQAWSLPKFCSSIRSIVLKPKFDIVTSGGHLTLPSLLPPPFTFTCHWTQYNFRSCNSVIIWHKIEPNLISVPACLLTLLCSAFSGAIVNLAATDWIET